jgi:hypothetical protein
LILVLAMTMLLLMALFFTANSPTQTSNERAGLEIAPEFEKPLSVSPFLICAQFSGHFPLQSQCRSLILLRTCISYC